MLPVVNYKQGVWKTCDNDSAFAKLLSSLLLLSSMTDYERQTVPRRPGDHCGSRRYDRPEVKVTDPSSGSVGRRVVVVVVVVGIACSRWPLMMT